jgi:hypothetical protein
MCKIIARIMNEDKELIYLVYAPLPDIFKENFINIELNVKQTNDYFKCNVIFPFDF